MRVSRRLTALALVVLLALVGLELYLQFSGGAGSTSGPWSATTPYPMQASSAPGVTGQSCVASNSYVYCIGGQDFFGEPHDQVYSASLSPHSGIGNWTMDANSYPQEVMFQSCVSSSGYVYCLGGTYDSTGDDVAFAYYAPLSSSGVGAWKLTTPYPVPVDAAACVTSSDEIYCIGGDNQTTGTNATSIPSSSAWYATLSSSGVGNWTRTTPYPQGIYYPDCATIGGYAYCVGGESKGGQPESAAYYASLSPQGIGNWTRTSAYPLAIAGESCVTSSTDLYCVGGWTGGTTGDTADVYYAQLTPGGIGTWQRASAYPLELLTYCVGSSGYVYCIGGSEGNSVLTDSVYYGLLVSSSPPSSSSSSSSSDRSGTNYSSSFSSP